MRRSFRDKSLFQLFVLTLTITIFLPVMALGWISYTRSSKQIEILANELMERVIDNVNAEFSVLIEDNDSLSAQIATRPQVKQFVEQSMDSYYERWNFKNWLEHSTLLDEAFMRTPMISGISIIGDSGISFSFPNTNQADNLEYTHDLEDITERADFFRKNLSPNGEMAVFTTIIRSKDKSQDVYFISLARRIISQNFLHPIGIMVIDIKASNMSKELKRKEISKSNIWIVDRDGKVIFQNDSGYIGKEAETILSGGFQHGGNGSFKRTINGQEEYFVYRSKARTGWKVMASIPMNELQAPVKSLRNIIIFTGLVAIPFAVTVGYIFIRSIITPIRKLRKAMKEAENEKWTKISENYMGYEIGSLLNSYNKMVSKTSELIETVYKAELKEKKYELNVQKAEFQALQMQINPHFLYNTLGVINGYALVADQTPIQEMVQALSAMFRYSVQSPMEYVQLDDEIKHVENYLLIQRYRQKAMPRIQWDIEKYREYRVLRLVLQPLVENIFQHAFPYGIQEHHCISICARPEEEFFLVEVEDNGVGLPWDATADIFASNGKYKMGIGLNNVHRRLQLAFGKGYGLYFERGKDGGTVVQVRLPVLAEELSFE